MTTMKVLHVWPNSHLSHSRKKCRSRGEKELLTLVLPWADNRKSTSTNPRMGLSASVFLASKWKRDSLT